MNDRIFELTKLTLEGKMAAKANPMDFDREDIFLPRQERESKQLCQYILNQEPVLTKFSKMTGFFKCHESIVGDAFRRMGHKYYAEVRDSFYLKPLHNLSTMEWQHATADYKKVLEVGLRGMIDEIESSMTVHTDKEALGFLQALKLVAETMILWAHKCSRKAVEFAQTVEEPVYKQNLLTLAEALLHVPEHKPRSFYEAVLTVYVCFAADPDSVGTLDRYLRPFYKADMAAGRLTREEASEYLQELFLMLQAATGHRSSNFTRGAESHFCVGGYLPNGEDGFDELSQLILESLIDLPTYIPQVTLRWTKKTPKEVFRFALDCERHDPNKRIAFQNDEKRIQCYTQICGFPYEEAVSYTTIGCNEPAFPGGAAGATSKINFARSIETVFHKKADLIRTAETYDDFYAIYLETLFADLEIAYEYDNKYNRERAKDINYLSSLFSRGCIEKARSMTQGASDTVVAAPCYMGITNVIDSLIVVKQFVYDDKLITMDELICALQANWEGYEDLRRLILNKGDFFGNDTDRSNFVAQKLYQSLYEYLKDKTNLFGYHWLVGDLFGYNEHHKWYGANMAATPDGRHAGDTLKFGLSQSEGRDRNGLTALLNSIAKVDPNAIGCGSTVTNFTVDEQLIRNDEHFAKTVDMLETYFQMGGVHFQLNYVSREDLLDAKINPDDYKTLRVRVSGFSEYFVKLSGSIQDEIISRTSHS